MLRNKVVILAGVAIIAIVGIGYGIATLSGHKSAKNTTNTNSMSNPGQTKAQSGVTCAKGSVHDSTYGQVDIDTCAQPQVVKAKPTQPWVEVDASANNIETGGLPLNNMPDTNCQITQADSKCHPGQGETVQVACAKTIDGQLAWYGILLGKKTILRMSHDPTTHEASPYGYVKSYTNKGDKPVGYIKVGTINKVQVPDCSQVLHGQEARMSVYMQAGATEEPKITLDPNN